MNDQVNIESLISKYFNNTITDDEHRELISWIAQSKENELMFNQIREILLVSSIKDPNLQFDTQAALERVRTKARMNQTKPRLREAKPRKVITISYRWAAVAAIFLILSSTMFYHLMQNAPVTSTAYQEVIVPFGSRSEVVLPDGSHVNLNAGSTLRYNMDFGIKRRDLWLDGEGFFDVRKSSTPFIVNSGTVQIKALGTSFNVRAYSSEKTIETTLVKGKIVVTDTDNQEMATTGLTLLPNQKIIIPRQKTIIPSQKTDNTPKAIANQAKTNNRDSIGNVILKGKVDPVPDISWKDNKWIIYREDLGNLAIKLERRFDVEIVFKDEQLKLYRYNGSLPDLSLEQVLNVMSMVSPVQYSINGKTVFFSENKEYKHQNR